MKTLLSPAQIQEMLRHVNCMKLEDFINCFGQDGIYLHNKFINSFDDDVFSFVSYLDSFNMNTLCKYFIIWEQDGKI